MVQQAIPPQRQDWDAELQYVVDERGDRVAVVVPIEEFKHLMEELEELYDVRAYDAARTEGGDAKPAKDVFAEIERERGWPTE